MACYILVRCNNQAIAASNKGTVCTVLQDWRAFGSAEIPDFVTKIFVPDADQLDLMYLNQNEIDFDLMPEPLPRVSGTLSRALFSRRVGQRLQSEYNSVRHSDFLAFEVV